jgi:hypothetical protein
MKIYIIKHKGANNFGNFLSFFSREQYGYKTIFKGSFFTKKKDAKLSLNHSVEFPKNYEIVPLEISKPKYAKCIYTYFPQLIEVGKKYEILAEHKEVICIIDEAGNLSTFNKCYFEIK